MSGKDWNKLAASGALENLKVAELKGYCKLHTLSQTGEKGTLMFRIKSHLDGEKLKIDGKNPALLKGAELKKAVASRGLSPIGTADELLESLMKYLKSKGTGGGDAAAASSSSPAAASSKDDGAGGGNDGGDVAANLLERIMELSEEENWSAILGLGQAGITRDSPTALLRKAYHRLSLIVHPDRCKLPDATKAFQAVVTAFERISEPEPEKEEVKGKKSEAKARTISRSNENCFKTAVHCPRCKEEWGKPIEGLPNYCYNYLMMGLKTYCCSTCLLSFGALTAIHRCPHCRRKFEYDPHDYHRQITCGNKGCTRKFGFYLYPVSDRVENEMRTQLKEEQQQRLKQRESKLARAARHKRKAADVSAEDDTRLQIRMFIGGLLDECPRCGEFFDCDPGDKDAYIEHLRNCKDKEKIQAHHKKKKMEEAKRVEMEATQAKQEDMQSLRTYEFLGGKEADMWLLTEGELARQCQEKLPEEEKGGIEKMSKDQMIARLVAHGQGQKLLTDGTKGSVKAARKKPMKRENLPTNLYLMSVSQLSAVCAAHGFQPKAKTQAGIIKEIEKEVAKSEGHEEIYLIAD